MTSRKTLRREYAAPADFQPLRWLILATALALDIFLCARYAVDKVL